MKMRTSTVRNARRLELSRGRNWLRPEVRELESRQMLAGGIAAAATLASPQKNYIESLNMALDGGKLSAAQVSALTRLYKHGASPLRIVDRILSLPATKRIEIKTEYKNLLGRAPSARQMTSGLALLRNGQDQRAVALSILASREFYARAGGNNAGFVNAVYQRVLGHSPSASASAAGQSLFASGASRRQVAAQVLNSPEMIANLHKSVSSQPMTPAELRAAVETLSRPKGFREMEAAALSSAEFVERTSSAPSTLITAPTASANPVNINGYVTGLPLGQNWDLASRWTPLVSTEAGDVAVAISTAGDGTVWESVKYGSGSVLDTYVPSTGAYATVFESGAIINSVAAISSTKAWVTTNIGSGYEVTVVNGVGIESQIPSLSSGDSFSQLASGTDGTIWALGTSGNPYVYSSSTGSWVPEPADGYGYKLLTLSVGSATSVWATTYVNSVIGVEPSYFSNGTWYTLTDSFEGAGLQAVSAAADGSVWALTQNNSLYTWNSSVGWTVVTGETPPGPIMAISAISQYRVNAIIANNGPFLQLNSSLDLLTYGLVDQPPVPFPTYSYGTETAYLDISQALNVSDPLGIRDVYSDPTYADSFINWSTEIKGFESEPPPSGVNQAQWELVTKQLAAETNDVSLVLPIFKGLKDIAQMVDSNNQSSLTTVMNDVQLSNSQSSSPVTLFLEAALEAGLAGLASAASGGGAIVAALIASGVDSAITDVSGAANPDYSTSIDSTSANLSTLIKAVYDDTNEADGDYEDTILGDWGKLSTLAAASASLKWDYSTDTTLAIYASQEFEQYFFETLMPARWQITHYYVSYGGINLDDYPSYDEYIQPGAIIEDDELISGTLDVIQDSDGDTPLEQLFNDIYSVTDVDKTELFTNSVGWLKVVNVSH